ncbi:uncharacterized protein TrAFT101_003552 [Trichoderma asperellum]|uniref:uncharacterized protein n=1 Tax=Trichoderma asperellum TaxID=101201 RepID=UPI003333A2E7|nr:hypothetical protein TrAFT101_003552 [Trichoderma asperellum]
MESRGTVPRTPFHSSLSSSLVPSSPSLPFNSSGNSRIRSPGAAAAVAHLVILSSTRSINRVPSRSSRAGAGGVTVAAVAVAVAASPTLLGHNGSFPLVSPLLVSNPQYCLPLAG